MDENQSKCFIHKGNLEDPYQCMDCQKIFCKDCIDNYYGNLCPNCRTEKKITQYIPHNKKKTINKKCKKCDKYFVQSEINQHFQNCNMNIIKCRFCNFIGETKNFYEHYKKKHPVSSSLQNFLSESAIKNIIININNNINIIQEGDSSKLGKTTIISPNGFFYCNSIKRFNCKCCKDNICKEDNCMCSFCQKKNCDYYEFGKNILINKYGNLSHFNLGKFCCNMFYQNNTKYCDVIHGICPGCESLFENRIHYLDKETYNIIQKMIDFYLNIK